MAVYIITEGLKHIPSSYALYFVLFSICATIVRAWSYGTRNPRDRDLHGRTIIVIGGFTPTGLKIVEAVAQRGAQVVALTPSLSDTLPQLLVPLLQQTTSNQQIYAEECDITSPASIRNFHETLVKGRTSTDAFSEAPRIDAIVFVHEYRHIGMWRKLGSSTKQRQQEDEARRLASLGTFYFSTIFLPFLLRAPTDRDIRIINVINPMYAASVSSFDPTAPLAPTNVTSVSEQEGERALRSIVFARHFQRVMDALASPPVPKTDTNNTTSAVVDKKSSNITYVTACPGFSRAETVAPFFGTSSDVAYSSVLGRYFYAVLFPLLFVISKSADAASQTPLYTLFVPHPSKIRPVEEKTKDTTPTLQGGELYRECKTVQLPTDRGKWLMDDESIGRAVWEGFEKAVEKWDQEEKERVGEGHESRPQHDEDTPSTIETALPGLKGKMKAT